MLAPDTVGEVLRMLRHRARCTRDELAAATGVSSGAISNYENDVSTPSAPTLRRIAVSLADLLHLDLADLWEELGGVLDAQNAPRGSLLVLRQKTEST